MRSDLEEIKSRLNIVDVIGEYIRLDRAGSNWRARCPFHNEKSPSFMVSEEKQIWHCFGCQKGGDIFGFVMEIEGIEFREALRSLAEKAGVKLESNHFNPETKKQEDRSREILDLSAKFYEVQLWKGSGKDKILKYLKERGLEDETIKSFRLGFAPLGWRNLLGFLLERGFEQNEILRAGLIIKGEGKTYDRFRDRIIFPIADGLGRIVGFTARVAPGGDESQAKYVNSPETDFYHKSRILYGLDKAKVAMRREKFAFLVEGNMDVIASQQAGIQNTIAVSGTALTIEQIGILKRYVNKVKMCFDMDNAGEIATKKSLKMCFDNDLPVEVVTLPEGKDAAELMQKDPERLKRAVNESQNAMEAIFNRVFSHYDSKKVEHKKIIADELTELIAHLVNPIEKNYWIKELSSRLDIRENILTDMIKKRNLTRATDRNEKGEIQENFSSKSKWETLRDDLMALMLVFPQVWKDIEENSNEKIQNFNDATLKKILEIGRPTNYDFSTFVKKISDPKTVSRFEKLFFEKKFYRTNDGNIEEKRISDPHQEAKNLIQEMEKEKKKERLAQIAHALKEAEENQEKEMIQSLIQEFKELSSKL